MIGEKLSLSNISSLMSYEVINEAKEELDNVCPGIVSCADTIIMASRDTVALVSKKRRLLSALQFLLVVHVFFLILRFFWKYTLYMHF
ncbi:Peroxidase 17 [Platanthera zijinensis]|uniref:Peroxidase 17 n=1 Tax=Platanthera zijinensis TaxID=2320716 RepID=A0AAP0GEZ0_9ASPA